VNLNFFIIKSSAFPSQQGDNTGAVVSCHQIHRFGVVFINPIPFWTRDCYT